MTTSHVCVEMRNAVKWIWINRPEVKNAINPAVADALREEVINAPENHGARIIVIAGKGGAFCSGAELKIIKGDSADSIRIQDQLENHYHPLICAMMESPLPVIAALSGAAVGIGCDLALAADMRIAVENSFLAEVFVNIGLIPDGGGTFHLPRLVGLGRAFEMAMIGSRIYALQALEWGLVNRIVSEDDFDEEVQTFAEALAVKAPLALTAMKRAMRSSLCDSLDNSLAREAVLQQQLSESNDFKEGVNAFMEKRSPCFKGK